MMLMHNMGFLLRAAVTGLLVAATLMLSPAAAETKSPEPQYPLTKEALTRWLECYPRMKLLAITEAMKRGKDIKEAPNPLNAVMKLLANDALRQEAETAVKQHGFHDLNEWLAVTHATAIAYANLKAGPGEKDVEKAANKLIEKIDELDFLTDKQKRKLEKKAREQLAKSGALRPTPENLALVASMEKQLDAVIK